MSDIILDASVLIGFHKAGWTDGVEYWRPEYNPIAPEPVWKDEVRSIDESDPTWVDVVDVDKTIQVDEPGTLSKYDWNCIVLAEVRGGILVVSDEKLKERAERRGLETMWKSQFALHTFMECGISETDYREGIEDYIEDAYLSDRIEDELRNAEKPS